jgi:transcriptional regulator with XRE-family HTH domain
MPGHDDNRVKNRLDALAKNTGRGVAGADSVELVPSKNTRALGQAEAARVRERTRELLEEHGSQTNVGDLIGIGQQQVGSVANGNTTPGIHFAKRVANFDRVPVEALTGGVPKALYTAMRLRRWPDEVLQAACKIWVNVARSHELTVEDWTRALKQTDEALARVAKDASPSKR